MTAPELFAAVRAGDAERVRELVDGRPELAAARGEDGVSAVLQAAYQGHAEIVDALLDVNPPLDVFDAAGVGRTRGLEELLDGDAELVRSWSADGFTPLHLAAFFGHEDAVHALLERGADPNVVARHETIRVAPLHSAAAGAHPGIVRLLLDAGADPNARQPGGFAPLHAAAQNDDRESAQALLEAGADPAATTDDGRTPADVADAAGHGGFREALPDL